MTQGDPLSPTIFNVVVDTVVRRWLSVTVEGAEERGEHGQEGRHQNALFYTDNGMVSLSDPRWLHVAFITLVSLFYSVGLKTNVVKKVRMVCHPCQAVGTQSEAACRIRMTGAGTLYR